MDEEIGQNKRRASRLMGLFMAVVVLVVCALSALIGWGIVGFVFAFVIAGALAFVGYWKSDSVVLAMSRAKPADEPTHARLHNLVEGLCVAGGIPKPRLCVIDDDVPNAFATGRSPDHATVAVTTGLLEKMNRVELEGILAHELSHIKNHDILVSTLAVTLVGNVILLADYCIRFLWWNGGRRSTGDQQTGGVGVIVAGFGFALLVFAPLIAWMLRLVVAPGREERADMSGAGLTRYPPGLIAALEKLEDDGTIVHASSRATAHLWLGRSLACRSEEGRLWKLNRHFETHPPLQERIERLREL